MSKVTISNTTRSPLGLPKGPRVPALGSISIDADDWAKKNSNAVVKSWLAAGALKVGGAAAKQVEGEKQKEGEGGNGEPDTSAEREAEFRAKTNPELADWIEKNGGKDQLKVGMVKDDLVALAMTLDKK